MALRLSSSHVLESERSDEHEYPEDRGSDPSSDEEDDEDQTWDDWVSDSAEKRPCKSLFENKTFDTVQEALLNDERNHGFSLKTISTRLGVHFNFNYLFFHLLTQPRPGFL